jgi:hypothetical protein
MALNAAKSSTFPSPPAIKDFIFRVVVGPVILLITSAVGKKHGFGVETFYPFHRNLLLALCRYYTIKPDICNAFPDFCNEGIRKMLLFFLLLKTV